ncbi:MAG: DUF1772 domain-containing protein [Shinella sp.]|nr:DUF1772 domain-containing protein [Shinella sp.]
MTTLLPLLTFLAALGAGLNAGLFFIFSVCIMGAFARLPAEGGMAAMNAINVVIINPWFFAAFFGTAILSLVLAIAAFWQGGPGAMLAAVAGVIFLLGTVGVTMVFNVPLNDALAASKPASQEAAALWQRYLGTWTSWNHVRSLSSTIALGLFILAFARQVPSAG